MKTDFKQGDLLLYFNKDAVHIVILDEMDDDSFTIITSDDGIYQYGYKIRIRNLTAKYFLKLDEGYPSTRGTWERYDYTLRLPPPIILDFGPMAGAIL